MKKLTSMILLTALLIAPAVPAAFAADLTGNYTWSEKLGRGLLNMVASPVELARTVSVTSKTDGPAYGWTAGLIQGFGRFFVRFGAGAVDTLTFPFEWPKDDRKPLMEPEYPWQKWDAEYKSDKL